MLQAKIIASVITLFHIFFEIVKKMRKIMIFKELPTACALTLSYRRAVSQIQCAVGRSFDFKNFLQTRHCFQISITLYEQVPSLRRRFFLTNPYSYLNSGLALVAGQKSSSLQRKLGLEHELVLQVNFTRFFNFNFKIYIFVLCWLVITLVTKIKYLFLWI